MHVVVTGANGFIGRSIAMRLRERGDTVVGVDLTAAPERHVVAGDVSHPGKWQRSFAGADLVVHTAALVSNVPTLAEAWRVNVRGTRHVLDAAVLAKVPRLVHISSVRVFSDLGFPDGVTEDHPVRPDGNPYVDTRVASEQVALQSHAAGEIAVTVVRPGDVYGPGSRPWTVLPVEMIKKNRFLLPAMGRGVFSPVYVDDLLDGVLLASASPTAAGQVYTIGGAEAVSCREFFGHYYRMLGKRGPVVVPTGAALAAARVASTSARLLRQNTELNTVTVRYLCRTGTYSIAKAHSDLGYQPRVTLSSGMERTQAWLAEQGML
ncbi:NAD(P)-dependent oxidoreductase [Mycolicibacterium sp. P1-18]|uniref:NAD-dependent epimerase/dehydratase family protein n=1 Tax=Mycolicibacterium sp. P1-18 TaxID=2024615 RepID=UPI0011F0CA1B|nr:NAD(P)-dependent oxidoreductase [Mycolicibacterium sp. P1-18]KAA0094721.1 NAD(P)-dependent oxidoreductase [Mycolicibacterium sp. P1-18]